VAHLAAYQRRNERAAVGRVVLVDAAKVVRPAEGWRVVDVGKIARVIVLDNDAARVGRAEVADLRVAQNAVVEEDAADVKRVDVRAAVAEQDQPRVSAAGLVEKRGPATVGLV